MLVVRMEGAVASVSIPAFEKTPETSIYPYRPDGGTRTPTPCGIRS